MNNLKVMIVNDPNDPQEVITWFNENPEIDIHTLEIVGNIFYIVYT